MKSFIITVDTEGDNLWSYRNGDSITTRNTKYIPRFQELCEKYGFKPVYLTNYEMLCDDEYVNYVTAKEQQGLCEIGLHLHAWNNPPIYELDAKYDGNPYLIEYPDDIMKAKFDYLYTLFCQKIGHEPYSHRAGRWAMDARYFKLLADYNVKVDCSVTPGIDWSNIKGATCGGSNYKNYPQESYSIDTVWEVPLTVVGCRGWYGSSIKQKVKNVVKGRNLQLRPALYKADEMKKAVELILKKSSIDYLEFMLHSSELMPGGSPYFKNETEVNAMMQTMDEIFEYIYKCKFVGTTLKEYSLHK